MRVEWAPRHTADRPRLAHLHVAVLEPAEHVHALAAGAEGRAGTGATRGGDRGAALRRLADRAPRRGELRGDDRRGVFGARLVS